MNIVVIWKEGWGITCGPSSRCSFFRYEKVVLLLRQVSEGCDKQLQDE